MPNKYYHLGIHFGLGQNLTTTLEPAIRGIANDWIRYAPNCWILWSSYSISQCSAGLRSVLTLNDQFAIFEIDPMKRDGFHYEWVWKWLNEPRYPGYSVPPPAPSYADPRMFLPSPGYKPPPR